MTIAKVWVPGTLVSMDAKALSVQFITGMKPTVLPREVCGIVRQRPGLGPLEYQVPKAWALTHGLKEFAA